MKEAQARQQMIECQFDVRDMPHTLRDGILTLEMPLLILRSDLLTEGARKDLESAGLKRWEIDNAADEMMEGIQARILGKMLQARRV